MPAPTKPTKTTRKGVAKKVTATTKKPGSAVAARRPSSQEKTQAASKEVSPAELALAWAHSARFLTTAAQLVQLPTTSLPEVAFVGRSNAGKSTSINRLANQKRLAFASKTPGRTQHVNLFALGPKDAPNALWADLPGYGYAAVERAAKLRWQTVMADYLAERESLVGVVLLVDSRIGATDLDLKLLQWIRPRVANGDVKLLVLLTKADKLSKTEARAAMASVQDALGDYATDSADVSATLFSALARTGVADVAETLHAWALAPRRSPRATDEADDADESDDSDDGADTEDQSDGDSDR